MMQEAGTDCAMRISGWNGFDLSTTAGNLTKQIHGAACPRRGCIATVLHSPWCLANRESLASNRVWTGRLQAGLLIRLLILLSRPPFSCGCSVQHFFHDATRGRRYLAHSAALLLPLIILVRLLIILPSASSLLLFILSFPASKSESSPQGWPLACSGGSIDRLTRPFREFQLRLEFEPGSSRSMAMAWRAPRCRALSVTGYSRRSLARRLRSATHSLYYPSLYYPASHPSTTHSLGGESPAQSR